MFQTISTALAMGFATGLACMGWCAPILLPYVATYQKPTWFSGLTSGLFFSLGRLISYTGLLLVFAFLKSILPTGTLSTAIATMLSGVIAIVGALGAFGILNWPSGIGKHFCQMASGSKPPFYLGLLTGLRPCAPLIAALTFALTLNGPSMMGLFLIAFWLASSALILLMASATGGLASKFGQKIGLLRVRRIAGITLMVVGLVLIVQAIGLLVYS